MNKISLPLSALVLVFLSGCASVTGTTGQSISVETRQKNGAVLSGAACELTNSKGKWFLNTPGTAAIRRSNDDMIVICNKDGHAPGTAAVVSETKGMMFGNIILGGGIGAIVDHNTGAAYEYPTLIQIMMGSNIKIEPPKPNPDSANSNTDASASNQVSNISTTQAASLPTPSSSSPASKAVSPPSERLKELNSLFKQGLISKDDFENKKAEILKAM
jgi:uncharacterized protein YceK